MIQEKRLQREIILRIFENLNIFLDGSFSEKFDQNLLTNRRIKIRSEAESHTVEKCVWTGFLPIADLELRYIVAELTDSEYSEFCLVLQLTGTPPYGLRVSADSEDSGRFGVYSEGAWIDATLALQAGVLSGIENMSQFIVNSKSLSENQDIFDLLISFLSGDF